MLTNTDASQSTAGLVFVVAVSIQYVPVVEVSEDDMASQQSDVNQWVPSSVKSQGDSD